MCYLCVSTCAGDRLAEVQVCEHLAECYLRQKKLQQAVELYKQALSALSHCKVENLSHLEVKGHPEI